MPVQGDYSSDMKNMKYCPEQLKSGYLHAEHILEKG